MGDITTTIRFSFTETCKLQYRSLKTKTMKLKPLFLILILQVLIFACTKEEDENSTIAEITTSEVSLIIQSSAMCGGNITSDGGKAVTARGVVWHTSANPTLETNTGKTEMLNDDIALLMTPIHGGSFQMGSEDGADDELPLHSVTLSSFEIGKYEVTQAQWKAVMDGANPSRFEGDNRPVDQISWDTIQTFLTRLNEQTGQNYRMPSEAEWEYAARGGLHSNGYTYAGSNTIEDVAWYSSNSDYQTHETGGKSANELGLFDMSGNVWEWCSDWYDESYYSDSPTENPQGPESGTVRAYRGAILLTKTIQN
jgi:formylglycine-generating enzyme required for sulfatase activity